MTRIRSLIRVSIVAPLAALCSIAGCGSEDNAATSPARKLTYEARVDGDAEDLWGHIEELKHQFDESEPDNPRAAREGLDAYTSAVIKTAQAIVANKDAPIELRKKAVDTWLISQVRRKEVEDDAEAKYLAATDQIETANAGNELSGLAAVHRVAYIAEIHDALPEAEKRTYFPKLADAVIRVGKVDPPPPTALIMLQKTAERAEAIGENDLAKQMFTLVGQKFPKDRMGKFAEGAIHRIDMVGKPLGEFQGPTFGGKTLALADFKGKVVLIDYWATWCPPCVEEFPELRAMYEKLKSRGFEVLGVCLDSSPDQAELFLNQRKCTWPQILTGEGGGDALLSPLALRFGVHAIPVKLLIDREGTLVATGNSLADVAEKLYKLFPLDKEDANKPAGPAKPASAAKQVEAVNPSQPRAD